MEVNRFRGLVILEDKEFPKPRTKRALLSSGDLTSAFGTTRDLAGGRLRYLLGNRFGQACV